MKRKAFISLCLFASIFILLVSNARLNSAFAQDIEPDPLPEATTESGTGSTEEVFRAPLYPVPRAISPHDHFYFIRPYQPDNDFWLATEYRYGVNKIVSENTHTGIDIELLMNTPVLASGPGTIVWAGWGLLSKDPRYKGDALGLAVSIEHDFGHQGQPLFTIYAHNNEILVELGDHVEAGDIIALSGNTGFSNAPHVHFEVRIGENNMYKAYNPELWISPEMGNGVLLGRVTTTFGNQLFDHEIFIRNLDTGDIHYAKTYSSMDFINRDPYFQENFALGDLPAGSYEIVINYYGYNHLEYIEIQPGALNYIRFEGIKGISTDLPPAYTHSFFAEE